MSEWISVNTRIPEKCNYNNFTKSVLGYCPLDKCQYVVCYNYVLKYWVHFENLSRVVHGGVSDWCELPEPPKKPEVQFNTKQEG